MMKYRQWLLPLLPSTEDRGTDEVPELRSPHTVGRDAADEDVDPAGFVYASIRHSPFIADCPSK
jgi:hypothetical protein